MSRIPQFIALPAALMAALASIIAIMSGQALTLLAGTAFGASIIAATALGLDLWRSGWRTDPGEGKETVMPAATSPAVATPPLDETAAEEPGADVPQPIDETAIEEPGADVPQPIDETDLLANKPWLDLVEQCVNMFDDLDRLGPRLDAPRREVAEQMTERLQDLLTNAGVQMIQNDPTFDRRRHEAVAPGTTVRAGAAIAQTLSPGFAVERRVLRRARVRVAA